MKGSIALNLIDFRVRKDGESYIPEIYCPDKRGDWKWQSMAGTVFPKVYKNKIMDIPGIAELYNKYPVFRMSNLYDRLESSKIYVYSRFYGLDTLTNSPFRWLEESEANSIMNHVKDWFADSIRILNDEYGGEATRFISGFSTSEMPRTDRGEGYFIDFTNVKVDIRREDSGVYFVMIQLIKEGFFGDSKKFFNFFSWILPENFGEEIHVKPLRGYIKDYGVFTFKSLGAELKNAGLKLEDFYDDGKLMLFQIWSSEIANKAKSAVITWLNDQYSKLNKIDKSFDMFTAESKRANKINVNKRETMKEIKITSGKLKSMIKEYVTDQKTNKLKGVVESNGIVESPMTDVEKIKGIVQKHVDSGGALIGLGPELKKAGYKSQFTTEPLAMHMIKIGGDSFVITNKKYISDEEKPDFVVGEYAGGFM